MAMMYDIPTLQAELTALRAKRLQILQRETVVEDIGGKVHQYETSALLAALDEHERVLLAQLGKATRGYGGIRLRTGVPLR